MARYLSDVVAFWLGGYDLTTDSTSVEMASLARDVESTTLGQAAEKFVSGIYGGEFSHDGILDGTAGQINTAGAALIGTNPVATLAVSNTAGKRAMSGQVLETSFKTPAPLGGLVMATVTGVTDGKVEQALVVQEKVTKTGNFDSASVDNAASSSGGGTGFLHIFAANGTADVVIEESSDDGGGDAFATVLTFAQFSAVGSQRVAITSSVERYIRVALTLGTATSVTYAVTFARL